MTTQLENKSPVTLMSRPIVYSDTISMFNRFCELMIADEFNLLEFAEFCRQYDDSITDLQARKMLKILEHANVIKYTELLHFKIV